MCALGLALSPAGPGDQARVRRLNEFHGHQICRTLRQKEQSMVPLASASARDPSRIKEHSEPDTGRSLCSFVLLFLLLASCFLRPHFLFAAILAMSAVLGRMSYLELRRTHVFVRGGSGEELDHQSSG